MWSWSMKREVMYDAWYDSDGSYCDDNDDDKDNDDDDDDDDETNALHDDDDDNNCERWCR